MVPGPMPDCASAASSMRKWVVLDGGMTRLRQSPTLSRWLKSSSASMNATPCAPVPLRSKLNTAPQPRGSRLAASA